MIGTSTISIQQALSTLDAQPRPQQLDPRINVTRTAAAPPSTSTPPPTSTTSSTAATPPNKAKKIRFVASRLNQEEMGLLQRALIKHESVRSLEMCLCEIDRDCLFDFAKDIHKYHLVLLQLVHVGLNDDCTQAIAESLKKSMLKKLDLSYNEIHAQGAENLSAAFRDSVLDMLLLGRNNIGVQGALHLSKGLVGSNMRSLDIRMNNLNHEGAMHLISTLEHTNLICIQLDSNNLTDETIEELCKVLPRTKLELLFLGLNNLTDRSLKALAPVVTQTRLKKIVLNGNRFTDEGVMEFASKALEPSNRLEHVDLRSNRAITQVGGEFLYEKIKAHTSLKRLLVNDTGIPETTRKQIEWRLLCLQSKHAQYMTALCSTKVVPRIATQSKLPLLPTEIFRAVGACLGNNLVSTQAASTESIPNNNAVTIFPPPGQTQA